MLVKIDRGRVSSYITVVARELLAHIFFLSQVLFQLCRLEHTRFIMMVSATSFKLIFLFDLCITSLKKLRVLFQYCNN